MAKQVESPVRGEPPTLPPSGNWLERLIDVIGSSVAKILDSWNATLRVAFLVLICSIPSWHGVTLTIHDPRMTWLAGLSSIISFAVALSIHRQRRAIVKLFSTPFHGLKSRAREGLDVKSVAKKPEKQQKRKKGKTEKKKGKN